MEPPRANTRAWEEQPNPTAKQILEAQWPSNEDILVTLLLLTPSTLYLGFVIGGSSMTVWRCRPGGLCPVPTTGPVRLGEYFNYFLTLYSAVPLIGSMSFAAAMGRASDRALEGMNGAHWSDHLLMEKKRKLLKREVLQTVLLSLCALGSSIVSGVRFGLLIPASLIAPPLNCVACRFIGVGLIRQHRERTPTYVRKKIWPRLANVMLFQLFCFGLTTFACIGRWPAPMDASPDVYFPACPMSTFNSTYIDAFCNPVRAPVLDEVILHCNDGGYGRFTSRMASCKARNIALELAPRADGACWAGLGAISTFTFYEYLRVLNKDLTLSNWVWIGTPRIIGAILCVLVGTLCCFIHFLNMMSPFVATFGEYRSLDLYVGNLLPAASYCVAALLLVVESALSKIESYIKEMGEQREAECEVLRQKKAGVCTFWFVKASFIKASEEPLPPFQDLCNVEGAMKEKEISLLDIIGGKLSKDIISAVSHRWERPEYPDVSGVQSLKIKEHLQEHPEVELVWYDYWCMPQGNRTLAQKVRFDWMLENVNLLYLGLSVIILLDMSYLSRFWTQFEAWLSMQLPSTSGLVPAPASEHRCIIIPIHNASTATRQELLSLWAQRTPEEAKEVLSSPDVIVTNQSDKENQLPKLEKLSNRVKETFVFIAESEPLIAGQQREEVRDLQPIVPMEIGRACTHTSPPEARQILC